MSKMYPNEWSIHCINEFAKLSAGGTPSTSNLSYWENGTIPWMSSGEVNKKRIFNADNFISELGYANSSAKLFPKKTILIALAGQGKTRGTVAISEIELTTNQSIAGVMVDTKKCDPEFLFQNLESRYEELRNISTGGGREGLNLSIIGGVEVCVPPLREQQKIAAILTAVDDVIESTQAQIDKLKDLKTGMMQELLTKGIGRGGHPHTEFKDSPVGRIPKGWDVLKLAELVKPKRQITYGIVQTGIHIEDGIPCVRVVDLMKNDLSIDNMIRTTSEISEQFKRTILESGDIMFALRGEIGHVKQVCTSLVGANLTRGVALISPNKRISSEFLLWAIRSTEVRKNILDRVNGSALQEIPLGNLRDVDIPVPTKEEQFEIVKLLDAIDLNTVQRMSKLSVNKNLKKALMQDLLTGTVRANVKVNT